MYFVKRLRVKHANEYQPDKKGEHYIRLVQINKPDGLAEFMAHFAIPNLYKDKRKGAAYRFHRSSNIKKIFVVFATTNKKQLDTTYHLIRVDDDNTFHYKADVTSQITLVRHTARGEMLDIDLINL